MKFEEKLKKRQYSQLWQEYCGFLDLDIDSYMNIQNRLMQEQISLWSKCELGRKMLAGKQPPKTIEEFREMVPLTTYGDYADFLLQKKGDMLPDEPVIWIQTTWECGKHPIKVAPYTSSMLDTYRNNIIACLILCTSTEKGKFNARETDKFLYALAPLPYATGLMPLALNEEISIEFLPPVKDAMQMTFSERNKKGFKMGLKKGIDIFFGLGSVAYYVSLSVSTLGKGSSGKSSLMSISPKILTRFLIAKYLCKKENRDLKPKDLFKLKGFMCAGTDNRCYKDDLEELWGVRPMELFAGTEPSIIGTETWTRNGMYFFPDACFYEFIPEAEMLRTFEEEGYKPATYLMNEVIPGQKYELVISVLKGGAFVRYRVGDVYECVGLESREEGTRIPRFIYIDRIPTIIDIAGFTRISEHSIQNVIELSGLPIENWVAVKEYRQNRPLMHIYVEMKEGQILNTAVSREILKEHLTIYFKYVDSDYQDLKKILGMDPLEITILKCGTFSFYEKSTSKKLRRINPQPYDVMELLKIDKKDFKLMGRRG
ncbi:GH3 family domain-containing protein [Parasporobacterium paucivorans]|uniref:GH3 auxin-responsive promoter n=1 Tax=Parasporobacterium paucivorans DSM 15970 TaxID=1122934 RepID=A0A1M6GZX6_9FIRM|nr:GH3 auxin-responsive promoter family protein [Parasporobacterium paucivorans]SHJ15454.1 GH3 auxin-responsive promoter [Parasporobacterium paucivorans DSM 15970]